MSAEVWAAIPEWEGFYEVSDHGRVKSCARSVPGRPGRMINRRERILIPSRTADGYLSVALCRDNTRFYIRVHRAVLLAFVGPCPVDMEACHADGTRDNNTLANLRWDTRSANTLDKVAHGNHPMASRTHCVNGHPFDEANTYLRPGRGGRSCKACMSVRKAQRKAVAA